MSTGFDQSPYALRCEWGERGLAALKESSDAVVIVDVLSFSTCVDVAVSRGAVVFPYPWRFAGAKAGEAREAARAWSRARDAVLAGPRGSDSRFSLSPASLAQARSGDRIVLPSPNGSQLSLGTGGTPTFAGCLRNARAVARAALEVGPRVSLIPAGERWPDGSLRPCLEDALGAGAILHHLEGTASPEASAARGVFSALAPDLERLLEECGSGRELRERGFARDVALACEVNASDAAPRLEDEAYR